MARSAEDEAKQVATALNELGHLAVGDSLEEARRSLGDAKLEDMLQESVTVCLELVLRTEKGPNPEAFPRSADAKAALSQLRDMLPALDWNDPASVAKLKVCARQALEALGFQLPE